MLKDLVVKNRSYRRFRQEIPIPLETLRELIDLGRLSASASNLQPLKYILCCDPAVNAEIFPNLQWARLLAPWPGPAEGERPAAYIIVLGDTTLVQSFGVDEGIALQSILLGAAEKGIAGCILGSVKREAVRQILQISPRYEILHVVALGMPGETVVLETAGEDGDVRYWRDAAGVHHVPKRRIGEVILAERA